MDLDKLNEEKIEEHNRLVYNGTMPARAKKVMREMLEKEDRFWLYFDRDHVPGKDDGEPPRGAQW
jgi:hypothetical protein